MAINPNFVFSDPRIQQGVVQMAQIAAAEEAARLQRQAQSQQSFTQAQVARDNAAAERSRNDAYLTQRERESARQDVTLNKDLELRRTEDETQRRFLQGRAGAAVADKDKAARVVAQRATLARIAGSPIDPPPPSEWATNKARYGPDLSPSDMDELDGLWKETREIAIRERAKAESDAAAYTEELQAALRDIKKDPDGIVRRSKIADIRKRMADAKQDGYLGLDTASGTVRSSLPPVRNDPAKGPGTANQEVSATDTPPRIRSLFDVPRPSVAGGGFFGVDPSVGAATVIDDFSDVPPPPPRQQTMPLVPPVLFNPPAAAPTAPPRQQFGSDLRTWQPPSFIPNTGSVGYYQPPTPPTFTPAPPQAASPDPGSLWNFLKTQAPWAVAPIFSERGLIGPMGLAGPRTMPDWMTAPIFGQNGIIGPGGLMGQQPAQIAPPPFVPPQYLSTDTPPRAMMPFTPPPSYPRLSPFNY